MPSWKKVIVSGSDAVLNSLNAVGSLTASGLTYPSADNGEESFIQTNGSGTLSLQYVKTIYEEIYNGEATTIVKGTPVYVSGSVGAASQVFVADAGDPTKMPVIYISADTINSGATGRGIALGLIKGVDTTGYPAGTEIYIAVGGGWTSTRPTGSAIVQVLGYVTKEGSGGQGVVLNPGPNNLPNLQSGSVWVGNSSGVPVAVATSSIQNVVSSSFSISSSFAVSASRAQSAESSSYPFAISGTTIYSNTGEKGQFSANNMVLIGVSAGESASFSVNSCFIGQAAGRYATNASFSTFIGQNAGFSASSAVNSVFIGRNAGRYAPSANNSVLIGSGAGNSTSITSSFSQVTFVGISAGNSAYNASLSTFLGNSAGGGATNASSSTFIGRSAGQNAINASYAIMLGSYAGYYAHSASYSILIGNSAGIRQPISPDNSGILSNNIIIGNNITFESGRQDSINIGGILFGTGSYSTMTGNSFSGSANGRIGINQPTPQVEFDVSGSGRFTNGVSVTGSLIAPNITGSLEGTASWAINTLTASFVQNSISASFATSAITASHALTASSADNFIVRQNVTASNLLVNGTITAQTLVVQTVTSSIDFVTGSTRFGTLLSNTHQFTGSVTVTGSLSINNSSVVTSDAYNPFSSSVSTRVTNLESTSSVLTLASASFAVVSSSYSIASASLSTRTTTLENASASFAVVSSSYSTMSGSTSARLTSIEGNYLTTGSNVISGSQVITGSVIVTGSINAPNITGSLYGTSSWALSAITASYTQNAVSASYAHTASYVNHLKQAVVVTGSINVTTAITASATLIGETAAPSLSTTKKITSTSIGANTIYSLSTSTYDGVFVEYVIRSGSVGRAGSFVTMWSGSSADYTDTSINGFGDTSAFTFEASASSGNIVVSGVGTTGGWTVKVIIRSI